MNGEKSVSVKSHVRRKPVPKTTPKPKPEAASKKEAVTDAASRPCLVPEIHTDVCTCYGTPVKR
jgi:hypothetical protein